MTAKYFWKAISPKHNFSNNKNIFYRAYQRGDFPLVLSHTGRGCKLVWKVFIIKTLKKCGLKNILNFRTHISRGFFYFNSF